MRRLQIFMDETLDEQLAREAAETGTSKAAIIRACVAERYGDVSAGDDPIDALVGSLQGEPADDVDEVVYGR